MVALFIPIAPVCPRRPPRRDDVLGESAGRVRRISSSSSMVRSSVEASDVLLGREMFTVMAPESILGTSSKPMSLPRKKTPPVMATKSTTVTTGWARVLRSRKRKTFSKPE